MKKKNNLGFSLMETLIVSVFVTSLLVFLFVQFQKVNSSYETTFSYNTVNALYGAQSINQYIQQDGYDQLINTYEDNVLDGIYYVEFSDCSSEYFVETAYCQQLLLSLNVEHVYFTGSNVTNFLKNLESHDMSEETKEFVRYINTDSTSDGYRLIVEYTDGEYATLKLGANTLMYQYYYTGNYQTFTVPESGLYRIEAWGAAGGGEYGGHGAYVAGSVYLNIGTKLYIYVGGKGADSSRTDSFNGGAGGSGSMRADGGNRDQMIGGAGGGASDVRLSLGDNTFAYASRIIVAAGGGGQGASGNAGGAGGALQGLPTSSSTASDVTNGRSGVGAAQTKGGAGGIAAAAYASNGLAGKAGTLGVGGRPVESDAIKNVAGGAGGGGGGYYGGGAGGAGAYGTGGGGAGGSSFISGYAGCNSLATNGTHTGSPVHLSALVFSNGIMIAGDESMPNPNKTGTVTGNAGNGQVNISYVSTFSK